MRKKASVISYIPFYVYPSGVTFTNGFTYDEVVKELKKQKQFEWLDAFQSEADFFKQSNYAASKIYAKDGKIYCFIFTKEHFRFTDEDYVKLAHECLHITNYYLKDILDRDVEHEAEAYFHSHLMNMCLQTLRHAQHKK
jgi:hypothetical protein